MNISAPISSCVSIVMAHGTKWIITTIRGHPNPNYLLSLEFHFNLSRITRYQQLSARLMASYGKICDNMSYRPVSQEEQYHLAPPSQ
jgi:hypothetical protein